MLELAKIGGWHNKLKEQASLPLHKRIGCLITNSSTQTNYFTQIQKWVLISYEI